jgi:hypothetical protein
MLSPFFRIGFEEVEFWGSTFRPVVHTAKRRVDDLSGGANLWNRVTDVHDDVVVLCISEEERPLFYRLREERRTTKRFSF